MRWTRAQARKAAESSQPNNTPAPSESPLQDPVDAQPHRSPSANQRDTPLNTEGAGASDTVPAREKTKKGKSKAKRSIAKRSSAKRSSAKRSSAKRSSAKRSSAKLSSASASDQEHKPKRARKVEIIDDDSDSEKDRGKGVGEAEVVDDDSEEEIDGCHGDDIENSGGTGLAASASGVKSDDLMNVGEAKAGGNREGANMHEVDATGDEVEVAQDAGGNKASDGDGSADLREDEADSDKSGGEENRKGGDVAPITADSLIYPNEFLIGGGNSTAFKHKLLSGDHLAVTHFDIFHTSLKRFTSDVVINVAADQNLRSLDCTPEAGWVWMHEIDTIAEALRGEECAREFSVPRIERILSSSVLFVPMHTTASKHWSVLVIFNMKSLFNAVLDVKAPSRGRLPPATLRNREPKPYAIHFDSFSSSRHKSLCAKALKIFADALTDSWKRHNVEDYRQTSFSLFVRPFVTRSLKVLSAKVEQQEDACTCGWRVVDAVRFVTERKSEIADDIASLSKEDMKSEHALIADRTLRFMQEQCATSFPDTPLIFYRMHLLLDEVCCSAFDANLLTINDVMVTYFDEKEKLPGRAGANKKKIAQSKKFESICSLVASKMEERGLLKRNGRKKTSALISSQCKTIAKYLMNFPRGSQYACCLYYTRYNYPTSILLCTSLSMLLTKKPRAFGNEIQSFGSRVLKSGRVLYRMAMFLDSSRSKARNWSRKARFRLQELEIHFTGITEAVLIACCREAQYLEDNEVAEGLCQVVDSTQETIRGSNDVIDDDDSEWSFDRSISIEEGVNENGQIRCLVGMDSIGTGLVSCLNAAEGIANKAILACITPFEEHCKKAIKMADKNVKLSEVEHFVTEDSMEAIHISFQKEFATVLISKIKAMWGHLLKDNFIERSLKPMISRLLAHANKCFKRNGSLFLEISDAKTALFAEPVAPNASHRDRLPAESARDECLEIEKHTVSSPLHTSSPIVRVREATSFGLGFHTSCTSAGQEQDSVETSVREFLSLFFYLLQGCRSHEADERYFCREFAEKKWGTELPECQNMLYEVWDTFAKSAKILRDGYTKRLKEGDVPSFDRHVTNLKLDTVIHAAAKIADISNRRGERSYGECFSDLFCYDIPDSYTKRSGVSAGGNFHYSANGQEDTALWHGQVTEVTYATVDPKEARTCTSGEDAMLGDFMIDRRDAPKLNQLDLGVQIECEVDFWTGNTSISSPEGSFLGFRMYSVVRIVFAFNNGKPKYAYPHPITGNYKQSLIGVIVSPVTTCAQREEGNRVRRAPGIGPKHCSFQVIVHDDVQQVSGCPSSIRDLISRYRDSRNPSSADLAGCYVMPVEDMSLTEDIWRFKGVVMCKQLPKPLILSLFDAHMADAYENERRKVHHSALRAIRSSNRLELLRFPSLSDLEEEHKEEIEKAASTIDERLNKEQLSIISSVLYGWRTKEAPNNAISLGICEPELHTYLRQLGSIPSLCLKWWGSRSCYIQGPPGTGKTRMLAALIAMVLERLEPRLRILVACETNKALDDIFVHLLQLFKDSDVAYKRVYNSLVRIGSSKVKVVQGREVRHLRAQEAAREVDRCRVVFTTFGSAHRRELTTSRNHFSLVLCEEICLVEEATALHVLTTALFRGSPATDDNPRKTVWVSVGDHEQRHVEVYTNIPVSRMVNTHFFDRVFSKEGTMAVGTRVALKTQYRMNPALAEFVSKQFYSGKLRTEMEGSLPWKDNNLFKALREHRRFPLRNVTVVDTSLEGRNAREMIGPNKSYYNPFEVDLIANVLKTWAGDVKEGSLTGKVTIITAYTSQRDELITRLATENLHFPVHTIDELQGGENDVIIVSLVRARTSAAPSSASQGAEIGFLSSDERINVALSRAKQSCMVVGFAKHIARHSTAWRNLFTECASNSSEEEDGTHAFYRPRYVQINRDMRFSLFNPSYLG